MAAGYHYGVKLRITPTGLSPASAAASLAALPRPALPGVFGRTDLSATLTARPVPHGIPVGSCTPPTGLPVLRPSPLLHQYPGGTGRCSRRSLPSRWQPSPYYRRVGFRITRFEACSAFTKIAARMLAEPPIAALLIGVLQTSSLPPSPAPTATGWSDSCRAGFPPAEGRRLRTAHGKDGLRRSDNVQTQQSVQASRRGLAASRGWEERKACVRHGAGSLPAAISRQI